MSLAFGVVAALGSLFLVLGASPGFVAQHPGEAGWDKLVNHLSYFGPLVVLSWVLFCFARPKLHFVGWALLFTTFWILGFCTIK